MQTLMRLYEPTSLKTLIDKGDSMHNSRLSPRASINVGEANPRRQSSYGIPPTNAIMEGESSEEDLVDKPIEEEKKGGENVQST